MPGMNEKSLSDRILSQTYALFSIFSQTHNLYDSVFVAGIR